jgi:hypothetical protein
MTIIYFNKINAFFFLREFQKHLLNDLIKLIAAIQIFVFCVVLLFEFFFSGFYEREKKLLRKIVRLVC